MAWTAEQMAQKRAKLQKKTNAAAGGAEPLSQRKSADSRNPLALGSTGNSVSDNSDPWTAEKMAEKRAALQTQKQQTGTDLYSTALEDYRTRNNLGFADAMDSRSDELNRQKVTVSPAGNTLGTWYGQQAQKLKNSYAEYSQPEAFDQANQWFDQPRNQELVNKLLEKKSNYTSYAETGTSRNGASAGDGSIDPFRTTGIKGKVGNTYSTADLKKLGYTDTEIRQAREYLDTMEEIPEWKQLARRTANTVGGVADTVAAAPLMGAEYLVQAGKNIRQSSENRKALEAELARNPREKNLYDQLMETDMDYQPKYSTGDLLQQGFTRQEIEDMRSRIAGTEAKGGIDTEKSVGYQLYNRGQQLTGAAQSGLTDVQRTVQGVATSAAENLAVAAINPAAVLPVLSAQGAADAMGKSAAKDESAGKALVGGVAKFGAGWAINSVGAADLARTMGADYARNSVAGAVADKIRALAGDSAFAAAHPAVANAISGGIDNAVQAFVETYADKAIDAALGDSEAAQTMFTTDTLVQALEAGLTGGASGALGGAVGTGLSRMNAGDSSLRGNVERYAAQDEYEQALKEHQRREELAREPEPLSQRVGADSPPEGGTNASARAETADGTEPLSHALSEGDAGSRNPFTGETAGPTAETAANRQAMVENAGESVESSTETAADGAEPLSQRISADSPPSMGAIGRTGNVELTAQNGADRQAVMQSVPVEESTLDGMDSGSSPMRETYGMEAPRTEGQKQARTEQVLRSWKVGEKAAQEISLKQPEGVDSDRYAAAASTLYRLGQMEDVKTFDQALELAGTGSGMAANVNYVLGNLKGRNALEIAYTYGRDAADTRWAKSQLGGTLTEQSLTGRGETIYKGTLRNANDAGSQVIELNAAATGTTAVLKNVLQNGAGQADSRVRAYVDTETARIFFGDSTQDTFGTVLHEDYHWYNALDSEGAKTLQDHALLYLTRSSGFETVDEMIREKMTDYAQQNLTYEEAAEELVGDAWRGIFSNESDFKRWVEFQRGQAEKNSGRAGTIRTVMNRVKEMLGGIISRAKEVLTLDPDNRAALKAQRLAENERRILQDEYFAHAEKAMDNLRSAKENAAAPKTESAAEGRNIRFSIQKDADGESYIKIDEDILNGVPQEDWKTVVKQAIKERYPNGFERNGWTILNHKDGRSEFVRSKSTMALQRTNEETYADKMRMAANLDEIIKTADEVYREPANHKNAEAFNRGKIKIVVGQNAYEADVLTAFKANDREIFYDIVDIKSTNNKTSMRTHVESKDSRSSLQGGFTEPSGKAHMESEDSGSRGSESSIYQESADTVLKTEEGGERPSFPAKNSIAQENAESKGNSEPVKKSVRFQLSDGSAGNVDELAVLQKESRELEHQQNALKTERTNWLNSAEVKEIEAKRKSLGLFSAEAKEFKASEEYQAYLAKRKNFNQRGAELENRIGEVNNALREAHAKLETQRNEQKQKQQAVYDAKAKEAGGAAKYRRQLAVEQFGTTSEFERAGYILPDGQMLDFARNDKTRDTDHREIMSVFGPAEVSEGTDALNKFLADGNVRVMAEAPGVDLAADKAPTAAQLEQIREMAGSLGSEQRKFTLDISTTDGRVAASKEYSGRIDADRVVREIRDYYKTGELPAESSLARFRYQLAAKAEQAERDARKNTQRQASRAIADNSAAMETLAQMMGVTHGVRISQDSIDGLAVRWTKANGSRADRTKIARETRALVEYMTADGASMSKASALSETIADEILSGATYRNTELWDEYPEYHDLSYTVNKDGPAKAELVKRYGTWSEAVAEARRHGVKLRQAEGVALPDSEKAEMLRDRLRKRIRETENRTYLPMTVDQMRMLKAITTSTLHVIRTANKTLSLQKAEAVDKIANEAAAEVRQSKGNDGKLRSALTRYNLDMLGAGRVFRMLGGYAKNSQMEKLGTMLNDGQREQTRITVEGTKLFDNVTGKANLRQMEKFAGPGAELVDIGLKDSKGRAAPLTHAQLCSLYMHLQNADSREHLLNGGLTIPDAEEYNKGDIEKAYQKGQTVKIGMLTDSAGNPMADTVIQAVEKAMTDYDRAWCEDMKNFFGSYTTNLINETSMKLLGYQRATVKNYYPIAVDKTALATQIEGVKLDATIEGRGFLKNRVKSQMPILLEECSSVVQRSLRDTAAYAGLAAPIRDVQKVLNSGIETEDGIKMLKNGILKEQWGQSATNYIDDLLTDLQTTQRKRSTTMTKVLDRLRGNYAGAILTLNPGVAIAQAASLPTAGAVLGADTMAAVMPFVKNLSGKQRAALEAEIAQHGDVLLRYRLRGSQRGELASIGVSQGAAEKAMDKLPKWVTGWINSMDEITVAALWEGSKRYVEHHTNEFAEGAATKGSEAYWEAVNKMYQRVIEETQPNYTTMQRAGIQRNPDQMTKTLTMFTTQRFQNYGIMADAVMDYNAQKARDKAAHSSETAEEVKRAGKNLNRAIVSQITQTAVFALMKIGADFLLHRWDREQDENGDVTAASVSKRFLNLYTESFAGNFLYGSELYSAVGNAVNGTDYDVVSATNISAVNNLFAAVTKFSSLVRQDTGDMTEEQLEAYHQKLRKAGVNLMQYGFEIAGVPMGNARKMLDAFDAYVEDARGIASGSGFSFSSTPTSATGQYDRLYNAIAEGDTDNASGAMAKLEAMGKDEKTIASQLKNRLKKYSPEVEQAAQARNEGKDSQRQELTKQLVREMYETLGIREGVKADAEKRTWVIDLVTEAIESKAEELYKGGTEGSVYDDLTEAVDTGRTSDVQDEIRRLRTAGKEDGSIKTKITAAVKEEYLAGNDHDREKLEKLLTSLTKEDGTAMYEEKNFAQWVKDAAKKEEQAKNSKDEWAGVR